MHQLASSEKITMLRTLQNWWKEVTVFLNFLYFACLGIYIVVIELEIVATLSNKLFGKKNAQEHQLEKYVSEFRAAKSEDSYIVITGANSGIGFQTATILATEAGCNLVLACRSLERGAAAIESIKKKLAPESKVKLILMECDISSLDSINKFVEELVSKKIKFSHMVMNAGIMAVPYQVSKDGFEMQLATNFVGNTFLTLKLHQMLRDSYLSEPVRFVMVSSESHRFKSSVPKQMVRPTFLEQQNYNRFEGYGYSKSLQLMFSFIFNKYLKYTKTKVFTMNSVHPGCVDTNIVGSLWTPIIYIFKCIAPILLKTAREGAFSTLKAVLDPKYSVEGGNYLDSFGHEIESAPYCKKVSDQLELFRQILEELRPRLDAAYYNELQQFITSIKV